jgi:hypothetical protein
MLFFKIRFVSAFSLEIKSKHFSLPISRFPWFLHFGKETLQRICPLHQRYFCLLFKGQESKICDDDLMFQYTSISLIALFAKRLLGRRKAPWVDGHQNGTPFSRVILPHSLLRHSHAKWSL